MYIFASVKQKTMKYILTLLLLVMTSVSSQTLTEIERKLEYTQTRNRLKDEIVNRNVERYYSQHTDSIEFVVLNYLKIEESLQLQPYKCSAGRLTIGYGHVILDGEEWMLNGISEVHADSILLLDFTKIKNRTDSYLKLDGYESYAMAAFGFNLGPNRIKQNKPFLNCIINDLPIDDEITRYTFFKDPQTKQYIQHNGLKNRRTWELNLYKQHKQLLTKLKTEYDEWQT